MAYFELAPLPFAKNALEPWIPTSTVEAHYEWHRGYVEALEGIAAGSAVARRPLGELVRNADGELLALAVETWNHDFYWRGLRPGGGGRPVGALLACLEAAFGGFANCQRRLAETAIGHAGSGWAWLVLDDRERLRVVATAGADHPLRHGQVPLYAIDVTAHAHADEERARERYVRAVIEHLIDWDFVLGNLERAVGARRGPRHAFAR
jgi:Fe-Mn family superoxide dismutase